MQGTSRIQWSMHGRDEKQVVLMFLSIMFLSCSVDDVEGASLSSDVSESFTTLLVLADSIVEDALRFLDAEVLELFR